jgi:zinc transporter
VVAIWTTVTTDGLIHALVLDGKGGARTLDWAGVDAWTPDDGILWLNLDYAGERAREWLEKKSRIDSVQVDALTDIDPRPRAVAHGDSLLMIVRGINFNAGAAPEDMISVRAWVEPRRIVTLRHRPSSSIKLMISEVERGIGARSSAEVAVQLVERMVDHVVTRVDTLGDAVASCEDQLLGNERRDLRATLAEHRRRAIALRRFLAPQREALAKLTTIGVSWFEPSHRARLAEVADHLTRTIEELDAARDRAAVTQEELSSRVAEAANQRLYVLSIITAVFLPLGFVCALLGVNVGGVPLQKADWAFWALCGAFVAGVAVQLWLFRKRGWL